MAIHTFCSTASIVVFVLCLRTGVAKIVTKPTGTEAVVGRSTYLNCSTDSLQEIHWFHIPFGSNQDRSFVYGYNQFYAPYLGRFVIEKNEANGAYNLIIPSVKVEDAGQYECQDQNGQGKKESAQLTVLDTDPVCEPRMKTLQIIGPNKCGIEPGQLILSCIVKYHGNEAPIMKWLKTGDKNAISEGVTHQITDNNLVVYNLTIKGNSTVKDGDSYFCNTTRSPTINDGCKSGIINVKGTSADYPTCVASEICKPYIKPYAVAIICIFVIILPTAIAGTFLVLWYLCGCRQKNRKQEDFRRLLKGSWALGTVPTVPNGLNGPGFCDSSLVMCIIVRLDQRHSAFCTAIVTINSLTFAFIDWKVWSNGQRAEGFDKKASI